jgi:hypothetical protein
MSGPVKRRLDLAVRIPMRGKIESLNAAVAGSILLFAAAQQRPIEASAPDSADSADIQLQAEAKPKRRAPAKKSVAKPKRTTIRKVDSSAMDECLRPRE